MDFKLNVDLGIPDTGTDPESGSYELVIAGGGQEGGLRSGTENHR